MYLKSLELHGFKSFPNKTVLNFEPGATVVIGPNGSGKSNISDAMRWVLGEISSKNIRGAKMEDVIFGGADTRKPMSFAEVSVTFDNTDPAHKIDVPYDEVTVTRRYYRSGESEYFINRKAVRLKDIHELFMNTGIGRDGYSVIGQGKIAEILSRKSEDRRNVFEEAAGIAKYRYKKHEAEKHLQNAEENLIRLTDIASELGSRVGPLEKESAKAKKYLEIYESKKRADVSLWIYDSAQLDEKINETAKALELASHELEVATDSLRSLETQSDKLFEESQKGKINAEKMLTEISELKEKVHAADSAFAVADSEIKHKEELIQGADITLQGADAAVKTVKSETETLENAFKEQQAKLAALQQKAADLEQLYATCGMRAEQIEKEMDNGQREIQQLSDRAVSVKVRISAIESTVVTETTADKKARDEIETYAAEAKQLADDIAIVNENVNQYRATAEQTDALLLQLGEKLEQAKTSKEEAKENVAAEKLRLDGLVHRADSFARMEELFEGYSSSVRYVMQAYDDGKITGGEVYGPISKLISVPQEYVTAIETAFGANIQNIAVENEDVAKSAIAVLKDAKAGRATFYPLTSATAQDETEEMIRARNYTGYIGRADLLFDYDAKFSEVMRSILGRTLIFDTLENASKMARAQKYHVKVVTLDGQIINAGGSYTGGSVRRDSGILTRAAEIQKLRAAAEASKKALEKLEQELVLATDAEKDAEMRKNGAVQQRDIVRALISSESARLDALGAKLETNTGLREKLQADIDRIMAQKTGFDDELAKLQNELADIEKQMEERKSFRFNRDEERNSALDEQRELNKKIGECAIEIAEAKKDIEALETKRGELGMRMRTAAETIEMQDAAIRNYQLEIDALKQAQAENRESAAQMMTKLQLLSNKRNEAEVDTAEFERMLNEARLKIREKNSQKEVILASYNKADNRYRALLAEKDRAADRMMEEYELTYGAALELGYPPLTSETRPEVASTAAEYRKAMKSIGTVNIGSIEEYAEVKKRYDEMSSQIADLTKSKADLNGVIHKLENEMRGQFLEAFNQINTHFGKVFHELFGGGSAELILTEPEDVLTSGIEIKAAPPGKIIKSLTLLSGGEQAFVAIALFFAILKVNPSPFCILDEIEAALDEVNVSRFADYVKVMSGDTQFIIITHRRGTMEAADRIYGVTMPERGISKVLSLNISEIQFEG